MKAICIDSLEQPLQLHVVPDSGVNGRNRPWFVPDDMGDGCQAVPYAGAVVDRLGMHIGEQFARRYYNSLAAAVHLRSDKADKAVEWCRDDNLTAGTEHTPAAGFDEAFLADVDRAIATVSRFMTLKTGDLVLLRTDRAPVTVHIGDNQAVDVLEGLNSVPLKVR